MFCPQPPFPHCSSQGPRESKKLCLEGVALHRLKQEDHKFWAYLCCIVLKQTKALKRSVGQMLRSFKTDFVVVVVLNLLLLHLLTVLSDFP